MNNPFRAMSMPKSKSFSFASSSKRGKRAYSNGISRNVRRKRALAPKLHSGKESPELKYYDRAEAFIATTTLTKATTTTFSMNTIPQGASPSERISNRVRIKSVQCKGYFLVIGADAAAGNHDEFDNLARFMIVIDHQCNGAVAPTAEILLAPTSINSFRDLDNTDRFTVLFDHRVAVHPQTHFEGTDGITTGLDTKYEFSFYKKGLDMVCQYDATSEAITSQVNNSIDAYMMIEDTLCAVTVFFNTRVRYTG